MLRAVAICVDDQFKLGRLLNGHISYRSASQQLRDLKRTLPKNRIVTRTIARPAQPPRATARWRADEIYAGAQASGTGSPTRSVTPTR